MIIKLIKYGVVAAASLGLLGGLMFGGDVCSYVWSSAKSVRSAVKSSVPVEFELQRARDMVERIIPEMHANIRLIAQEEVEIEALKRDIAATKDRLAGDKNQIAQLRNQLDTHQVSYTLGGRELPRQRVAERLAQRFERFKEGTVVLAGKERLLETRERSLDAAAQMLDRTKTEKVKLEQRIEALAAQHRRLKASSVNSQVHIDGSQLTSAEKLINEIQKRLDVAERVLAHESDFVDELAVPAVSESELLSEVDEYLSEDGPAAGPLVTADAGADSSIKDGDAALQ